MSDTELKPIYCPCCGSDDVCKSCFPTDYPTEHCRAYIQCNDCGLEMHVDGCVKDTNKLLKIAVEKWNIRRPMERIVEQLEENAYEHYSQEYGMCTAVDLESTIEIAKAGGGSR